MLERAGEPDETVIVARELPPWGVGGLREPERGPEGSTRSTRLSGSNRARKAATAGGGGGAPAGATWRRAHTAAVTASSTFN
jgi:hypothetical protein